MKMVIHKFGCGVGVGEPAPYEQGLSIKYPNQERTVVVTGSREQCKESNNQTRVQKGQGTCGTRTLPLPRDGSSLVWVIPSTDTERCPLLLPVSPPPPWQLGPSLNHLTTTLTRTTPKDKAAQQCCPGRNPRISQVRLPRASLN